MTDKQVNDAASRVQMFLDAWRTGESNCDDIHGFNGVRLLHSDLCKLQSQLSQSNAEIERRDELLREAGDALAFALGSKTGQLDQRHQESMVIIKAKIDTLATESQDG